MYLEAVVKTTSTSPGFLEAFRFNLLLKSSSTRFQLLQGLQRGPLLSHLSLQRPSLKVSRILSIKDFIKKYEVVVTITIKCIAKCNANHKIIRLSYDRDCDSCALSDVEPEDEEDEEAEK